MSVTGRAAPTLALALAGVTLAGLTLVAACGTRPPAVSAPAPATTAVPLSTSLVTGQGAWAVAAMGGGTAGADRFWQLFARPAGAGRWSLVTPPGVADNGGLVAAGGGSALVVGVRPSQNLVFSPLATSTDAGRSWTPGLLDAGLADAPGAIALGPSGRLLAVLRDGTIEAAPTAGAAAAGRWTVLTTFRALAASAQGRSCGLEGVTAVSFGPNESPIAAGGCARPGAAGVFTDAGGTWRSAGLWLPGPAGRSRVRVLGLASDAGGNMALLAAGQTPSGLRPSGGSVLAAWLDGARWTVSAPVAGSVRAFGFGGGGSAWLLLGDGRAESIGGAGRPWEALPLVPAGTQVLAPGAGGGYEALAVDRARLAVWRLERGSWVRVQQLTVPIQYGSSG
ncbi:MAG TPA: hypothetical protein VFW50_21445 [Streptosporangiaceae bacterium]|nr:hypothetical protein [Streptosporangiaceae bacterium]